MEKQQEAFAKYCARWSKWPLITSLLYRQAIRGKTVRYTCRLVDHIFSLTDDPTARVMKHSGYDAGVWIEWMIK